MANDDGRQEEQELDLDLSYILTHCDLSKEVLQKHFQLPAAVVDRLLKGLFVYTFGLDQMISDMVRHCRRSTLIRKVIWESYMHLLESADRDQYEQAIASVDDRDRQSGTRRAEQLAKTEAELVRAEASLGDSTHAMETIVQNLSVASQQLNDDKANFEYDLHACRSENHELLNRLEDLHIEHDEWTATRTWHEGRTSALQAISVRSDTKISGLTRILEDLDRRIGEAQMVQSRFLDTIKDLNLRSMPTSHGIELPFTGCSLFSIMTVQAHHDGSQA